jgi:acyl-[acyl-carrier-protein] desaturase
MRPVFTHTRPAHARASPKPLGKAADMEAMESLQGFVEENLSLLAAVDQAWQPTDFLPDFTAEDWADQIARFRASAQHLSDALLVVLVGNMVTEEALPNYAITLEHIAHDPSGASADPWALWLRGWTAEENRHGALLNAYLRLTGRVDIRSVERTVHHLINNGFNVGNLGDNYAGLIYAAFQERATRTTHGNVGRLAAAQGDENLARICRKIAGDEISHEVFYTRVIGEIMDRDPAGGILAYREMLKGLIAMPGRLMDHCGAPRLFEDFASVTQRIGAYTALDYAKIIGHLNEAWGVERRSLLRQGCKGS